MRTSLGCLLKERRMGAWGSVSTGTSGISLSDRRGAWRSMVAKKLHSYPAR